MNRLGFINFWKFKKEEFFFADGCALIRGHNGSGKSIVIQSAVTFLLDGSMRKLDPSGTNAREMAYYLIGEDKKEGTGYVFLEFAKGNHFCTIGIGMRAVRNRGVDFWGFGIQDGRRVEKDFSLYKEGIPLTKKECKSLITSSKKNFFTDKKKDYEKEVNQMLFGLSPYRYKELISLLSEIRKPIAGADRQAGLRFIYDKLNHSLSALREEDFDALASSMEMMDEYNEKLQMIKEDYERISRVSVRYRNYLDSLSYKKYLAYKEETLKAESFKKQWLKSQKELDAIFSKRKQAYLDLNSAEMELAEYDFMDEYSDQEKRNARLKVLEHALEEAENKEREDKDHKEQCDYDIHKSQKRLKEIQETLQDLEEKFTWTPDLEETILTLLSYYIELEAMPQPGMNLTSLKNKLIDYLKSCNIYDASYLQAELLDTLDDSSLSPEEKISKTLTYLLEAFLKTNNRYVERNAYIKHKMTAQGTISQEESDELSENTIKLQILFSEYTNLPSLAPLILLDPEIEEKRYQLNENIKKLENTSLFERKENAKEYRILADEIRGYKNLTKERDAEEKNLRRKQELYTHFEQVCEEEADRVLEIRGEIHLLENTIDGHFSDVLTLREKIIELRSLIRNFDSYVIPERKESLKEKEEAYLHQKDIAASYISYADLSDDILEKYKTENYLDQEHLMIEEYMHSRDNLHRYSPSLLREKTSDDSFYSLSFTHNGRQMTPEKLLSVLEEEISEKNQLLSKEENDIYQKVLMDCLVEKINHQIEYAKDWIQRIRDTMLSLETTSGMVFGIKWVRTKEIDNFSEYFKNCMESYREENEDLNYMECIMECLDYRNWFEFRLEMNGSPLSNKRFLTLSGGERATAIYSALLSALTSMFNECRKEDHPRLFALDEAFTVVDGENIESVFAFIGSVGLDYLINSQTLWGTYPTVPALSISNLTNLKDSKSVVVHRFLWKNNQKIPQFTSLT